MDLGKYFQNTSATAEDWDRMAAKFQALRDGPGGDKLTAVHRDGYVIEDVAGASVKMCRRLAEEARKREAASRKAKRCRK